MDKKTYKTRKNTPVICLVLFVLTVAAFVGLDKIYLYFDYLDAFVEFFFAVGLGLLTLMLAYFSVCYQQSFVSKNSKIMAVSGIILILCVLILPGSAPSFFQYVMYFSDIFDYSDTERSLFGFILLIAMLYLFISGVITLICSANMEEITNAAISEKALKAYEKLNKINIIITAVTAVCAFIEFVITLVKYAKFF